MLKRVEHACSARSGNSLSRKNCSGNEEISTNSTAKQPGMFPPASLLTRTPVPARLDELPATRRAHATCRAAPADGDVSRNMPYNYVGTDGKRKASLADAFSPSEERAASSITSRGAPWSLGYQVAERNLNWNSELASRLVKRVAAEELDCSEAELEQRVVELVAVLPGLAVRMHTMKAAVLARLARNPAGVAERLLQLKAVFPSGNVEQMALRDLRLLLELSVEDVTQRVAALRELLPEDVDVDRLCEEHPSMLEVESFKAALDEVRRLMPQLDISRALQTQPEIIFSTQRHNAGMIEYDPVPGRA